MKYKYDCKKCGHEWNPKSPDNPKKPLACPRCKQYKWDDMTLTNIQPITLSYLAGFFDGEGCVCVLKSKAPADRREITDIFRLSATISNTDRDILETYKKYFGGVIVSKDRRKETHKICYMWSAQATKAKNFFIIILPYLRQKKEQAELAIKFQENMHKNHNKGNAIVTGEDLEIRDYYYTEIKRLKRI